MISRTQLGIVLLIVMVVLVLSACGKKTPPPPAPTCADQVRNQNETDVDCGGPNCGRCADNKGCLSNGDCLSNNCVNGICKALETCKNEIKNQDETDIDCGGSICRACPNGKSCKGNGDCDNKYCSKGVCGNPPAAPTCTDNVKNQDETDVDCGGAKCPKCLVGRACSADGDCQANFTCADGKCAVSTSCSDLVKNGEETDTDCGGTKCKKCPIGKYCKQNYDCLSNMCIDGKCQGGGTCRDLKKNQDETDADCGGSKCPKCAISKSCKVDEDCQSNYCFEEKCLNKPPQSCLDQVKNNDETGVDCGGAQCPACKANQACRLGSDCQSGICSGGFCQP